MRGNQACIVAISTFRIQVKSILLKFDLMKVLLDIDDKRVPFFMELLKSLDYINILKEVKSKEKSKAIQDLAEAFNDVRLHEEGKKQLKSAKDLLDEL